MKILVGISGGVDSAFAARLLADQGHHVEGCVLVMHEHTDTKGAERVAKELSIPLHKVDLSDRFSEIIKTNFVSEYLSGRTPNPCIICNERVKFAGLYEYAMANGFDMIATGHYARILKEDGEGGEFHALYRANDLSKDQSYMLYRLSEEILSRTFFPLGEMTKDQVRRESSDAGLSVAGAKDSQEICFLPEGNYAEYIESVAGPCRPGSFIDESGNPLGEHKGIIRYTVGQRKGLGIALGKRMFVVSIDPASNQVVLGDNVRGKTTVKLRDVVLSANSSTHINENKLSAKLRYTAPLAECELILAADNSAELKFTSEVKAAPGQSAVIYCGDRVVLGGIIDN